MRRLFASIALLAITAALLLGSAGCSHKLTGRLLADKPPHTLLFVQGPVDTVNHLVHMYWYGTDVDGYVTGYQIKLVNPEDPVAADSAWHFTTRTDTILSIYTPAGHASPTMYARAIDNQGELDPTPAVEKFNFRNKAPVVTWQVIPNHADRSDTSFASVTVSWTCSDPDGDPAKIQFRLWLDGNELSPDVVPGNLIFTVPSSRFLVGGTWTEGPRTLFLQAIDDGGMTSSTISTTWYVRKPVSAPNYAPGHRPGRLLIVDDVPGISSESFVDSLYTNTASRNLPDGSWSVLHLDKTQPFKTSADLEQTMKLFDVVLWYRASADTVCSLLKNFEPGLRSYLDSGGSIYLEALCSIQGNQAAGALSQDFLTTYLDCDGLRSAYVTSTSDSTQAWMTSTTTTCVSDLYADTLNLTVFQVDANAKAGVRVFNVRHASDVALTAPRDNRFLGGTTIGLTPYDPDNLPSPPLPVAISVMTPAGGRAVVFSVPIARATPKGLSHVPRVLARVFGQLGLTGP